MKAPVFAGFLTACLLAAPAAAFAENYPQFRGAAANAVSPTPLPVTWSDANGEQTNIRWQIPLEGEGWSQPIVWGNRLFMTAAVPADPAAEEATKPESNNGGYGRDRDDLVKVVYEYRVICLDTQTGEQVWNTTVKKGRPPMPRHSTNTYATETPVTDGQHIYAYFGMNGLYCLDMDGGLVWERDLGVYEMRAGWGTASSPTLLDDRLFLQIDNQEQSFLVAIDTATGEDVWRVNRDESSQYSTPFLWKNSLRTELIVGGMVYRSHDPATGELLWQIDMNRGRSSATPVAIGDRLFVGNEFRNRGGDDDGGGRLYAIIPGGSGDITPPGNQMSGEFVQWRMDDSGIQMASPTCCGGNLYFFERRRGIVHCVDVETGRLEYTSRVRGADAFWASPWTDGRHVYALDSNGNTHVLKPSDEGLDVVAVNTLEEQAWGTPAVADGCIFIRTVDSLSCIAAAPTADQAAAQEEAATHELIRFETKRLSDRFFSEGAGVGDLDGDGQADLVAGPFWYAGPDFTARHELYEPKPFDPHGYSDCFFQFVHDIDRDGDNDVVIYGFPGQQGWWLENPGADAAASGHWSRHLALDVIDNESPRWVDIDGDGSPEIVCSVGGCFGYASIPAENPRGRWTFTRISPEVDAQKFTHGLGVGDVDGDGRLDILEKGGWWQQPESLEGDPLWERHAFAFAGPGGAQMYVRDVDGDGLNDVITSLAAHGWGLVWYRQTVADDGSRSFEPQVITGESLSDSPYRVAFSQIHAIDMADIDGDGLDDIITGKRYWAHGPKGDPEPEAPAVVYWFRCVRSTDPATGKTQAEFVPQLVDDNSGVGVEVKAVDVSGDGLLDIVVGNKQGAFVHRQSREAVSAEVYAASQPRKRRPMADGLSPQAAAEAMTVPPGFTVTNLAAEPDVRQPIAMAFDHRGRLWVAEAYSYPVRLPEEEARDRILIFEDTDGDDVFDQRTVFIEGLNLVSGLEVGFGGVWVGAAPYLMFIPDADGDDVPDGEPEILLDGWAWQDTHETLNAFTWGPDGWLYGCHGVFTHSNVGKPGASDADRTRLNAAIWRYHPTKHAFEVFAEGTSNPWGVDFNDVGDAFETACVIPHLYHMIQNGRYQRQAGQHFNPWSYDDIKTIARHRHWTGGQWNQADREKSDAIGGGHAHSGAMVYLGGAWPERYRGKLFMNNIHGARLNMDRLEPAGSGYVGDGEPDFLFANDTWSQIIALQYGPDGQVTFIDWYDANQCHHNEFEKHDRENGRIFKVAYIGTDGEAISGPADVAALADAQLVDLLAHTNDWYVRHARRVLQERAASGSLESGTAGLLAERLAAATTPEKRLRVLWAMHVTESLDEATLLEQLADDSPHVRGWAIQLACEGLSVDGEAHLSRGLTQALEALAADDPSPVVRRFLASAAGRMPLADRWEIMTKLVAHEEDASDHNLPLLEWYAVEPLVVADPSRALKFVDVCRIPTVSRFLVRRAAADEAFVDPLIEAVAQASSEDRAWMLTEVISALEARGRATMPTAWEAGYEALQQDDDENVRRMADDIAARFGDPRVRPMLRERVADASLPLEQRLAAIDALVASRDTELPPVLHELLMADDIEPHAGILTKILSALAAIPHEATAEVIVAAYGHLPADSRQAAIATLTARPAWTLALLDAIDDGRVPRNDLSAFTVGRLAESADEAVLARLKEVWGTIRSPSADRQAAFAAWRETLSKEALAEANLSHGREMFAKTCGSCHKLHGVGAEIGPELTGSNRRDLEYLLANLLDPSALVGRDYQMTQVVTTDGRVIGGIVVAETPTSIALQTPTERIVVPLEEIDVRELSTQSLMPENQLAQMPQASAVALVAYLQHPTQVPLPGEGPPPFNSEGRIAGAIEGEALKVRGTPAGRAAPQPMGNFKAGRWSGSSHLWWTGGKPGDTLTLDVPVKAQGTFEVFAILTKAPDYATVSVRFNDGPTVGPVDLYDPQVIQALPLSLGRFALKPGISTLKIEVTGTNPKAVPAYMTGLDCLYLVPVQDPPLATTASDSK